MIELSSKDLRLLIDPDMGSKLRSLVSRRSGFEFLFQDFHCVETRSDYSAHDMSGMDDCFPTVGRCEGLRGAYKDVDLNDHGLLWNRAWSASLADGEATLTTEVGEISCRARKVFRLEHGISLRVEYRIENFGNEPLDYIYSAHPLLNGFADSHFILPDCDKEGYLEVGLNIEQLPGQGMRPWADLRRELAGPFRVERNACLKCYAANVLQGRAGLAHPSIGEALKIEFDPAHLPHLGLLTFEGYGMDDQAPYRQSLFFAIEPTTSLGDDHAGAYRTRTLRTLSPGQSLEFWIVLSIVDFPLC